jgi:predicted PP-loop superfamily ATPase
LPETFPGIKFDEAGVCNYCLAFADAFQKQERLKQRLRQEFHHILEQVRGQNSYDCLMSWSGGKDSTYTLMLLKQDYDLDILAFTFDMGFTSPTAFSNMRRVSENLGVDHVIVKPRFDLLRQVFVASTARDMYPAKALHRASNICTSCMGMTKGIALRMAIEKRIPIIAYGWSPGQASLTSSIFKTNPQMMRAMLSATVVPLQKVVGDDIAPYFPAEHHFDDATRFIQELGWECPDDTDPNSTNCLLNAFANEVHKRHMGYHPYVLELANLVRGGYLDREEALRRLGTPPDPVVLTAVRAKLGLLPY